MNQKRNINKTKKALIVGDWVLDEHWVTGIHRSPTSSRTGYAHNRALHGVKSTTKSFCAAGRTASLLFRAEHKDKPLFNIIGIGMWHKNDTEILSAMLDPGTTKGLTPFSVFQRELPLSDRAKLFNIGESICQTNKLKPDECLGTIRVIRIYQHTGADVELLRRIDWEIQNIYEKEKIDFTKKNIENSSLSTFLKKEEKIDTVIINDICKGVVTDELIKWLASKYKEQPWFVSTKEWRPSWLKYLPEKSTKLIFVHPIAAVSAIRTGKINTWLNRSGNVSKECLEMIDLLGERFKNSPYIVIMPDELQVIGCISGKNKHNIYIQIKKRPISLPVQVPIASVFFSSLISNYISNNSGNNFLLKNALKDSFHYTQAWMIHESKRVKRPNDWDPNKEPIITPGENNSHTRTITSFELWKEFDLEDTRQEWDQAFSELGIIDDNQIELWRSMIEVDGYVCCVESKRQVLSKLVQTLQSFKIKDKNRHKSCMLIASPGSGKTFLIRKLATSLGMRFLPFNITQMLSKSDILDCFDTIVTTQSQNRDEPIIVFFDEINATLEGQYVYDIFLAPLEEGSYIREGKTFYINPCCWFFAGTDRPLKSKDPGRNKSSKASDFESRLTLPPLDIKIDPKQENDLARVEKVYLGVSLLRSFYPDVRRVSKKVLRTFHSLTPDLEVRDVEQFVKSFIHIQYGEVRAKNVPVQWLKEHPSLPINITDWRTWDEGKLIDIIE